MYTTDRLTYKLLCYTDGIVPLSEGSKRGYMERKKQDGVERKEISGKKEERDEGRSESNLSVPLGM